jgi:hypothetical protein
MISQIIGSDVKLMNQVPVKMNKLAGTTVSFSIVDGFIYFSIADKSVGCSLGDLLESEFSQQVPKVLVFGSGKLVFSHLAIYRDIYYTGQRYYGGGVARGSEKGGFTLGNNEYFVLGDNSPASYDSRWWTKTGYGNNGTTYTAGIVPKEYLLGKAVCVYWPSGFRLFKDSSKSIIPNIGKMRLIYGGTE